MRSKLIFPILCMAALAGCTSTEEKTESKTEKKVEDKKIDAKDEGKGDPKPEPKKTDPKPEPKKADPKPELKPKAEKKPSYSDPVTQVYMDRIDRLEAQLTEAREQYQYCTHDAKVSTGGEKAKFTAWAAAWKEKVGKLEKERTVQEEKLIEYHLLKVRKSSKAPSTPLPGAEPTTGAARQVTPEPEPKTEPKLEPKKTASNPAEDREAAIAKLKKHADDCNSYSKAFLRLKERKGKEHKDTQQALRGFAEELAAFDKLYKELRAEGVTVKDLPKRPATK